MLPGGIFSTDYASELAIVRTRTQWFLLVVLIAFFLVILPETASAYWLAHFHRLIIIIIAVLGLHILTGLCGLVSIGTMAFMAVGAYTTAILATRYDINGFLCLPVAALAAGVVGVLCGLPSFRLKLFYLAISTIAAHEIIMWIIEYDSFKSVTGGSLNGISLDEHPLQLGGIHFDYDGVNFFRLAMVVMIIATFFAKNFQRSHTGRSFIAIRDNELAAEISGISVYLNKLKAFFIGCAFAGVAGWLLAYSELSVKPSEFDMTKSMWYLGMLIIGGWGSTTGVFMGAIMLWFLEILNSEHLAPFVKDIVPNSWADQVDVSFTLILYGVLIILFIRFLPWGLYQKWERVKLWFRLHPYSHI